MEFLGLNFDSLDEDAVVALLRQRRPDTIFGYLVTPNVDHVVRLSELDRGGAEHAAYRLADWCVCDSRVLSRLASLRGIFLPVVPGSDLSVRLFGEIAEPGDRICLIGGQPGDISALGAIRPGVAVVQHIPPMNLRDNPTARAAAARFAVDAAARFVVIAVGSPQQEMIAAAIKEIPGAQGTALCVGAAVDFLTGRTDRAPKWMQRLSLEWLHRLLGDPRRLWRRYLVEGPKIFLLAWKFRR